MSTFSQTGRATEILAQLVAVRSVVGQPNYEIVSLIEDRLNRTGARVLKIPGPEGDRANILASYGPLNLPGFVLSGHMDVVPANADDWLSDPFLLRRNGDHLYGRGTSDMKGFLACVLQLCEEIDSTRLAQPLHIALSYDEEAGCRGVPHLIRAILDRYPTPVGCVVGEPTSMRPVFAHKGKLAKRICVTGKAGHSSSPAAGLNAIHALSRLLSVAIEEAETQKKGPLMRASILPTARFRSVR
jgi:acetylornithine deacetylase